MTQKVRKYLGKLGDNGILFFMGKVLLRTSVLAVPTQVDSDGQWGRHFQNLGKSFFLGKQDQQEKEFKSDSKKAIKTLHQINGRNRRCAKPIKNRH